MVRIGKEREESGMVGHARMDERMDEKVSMSFMTGLTVEEAGEEGKTVLIVRVSKDEQFRSEFHH